MDGRRGADHCATIGRRGDGDQWHRREHPKKLRASPARRFAYRLALNLGRADVDAMLDEMSAIQFREWMAYAELEPFGGDVDEIRSAQLRALIMNAVGTKDGRTVSALDLLPEAMTKEDEPKSMENADPDGANARSLANFLTNFGLKKA